VPDQFQLSEGQLTHRYSKSLLAFAVDGLPHASGAITVKLPKGSANPAFDSAFVEQMIDSLDLHRRYSQQLRARYTEETTHRAMTLMRDSAMALTACSAELQGHLRDGRSQELLHLVRGDNTKGGSTLSMGSLTLAASGAYFKDVLVFMDRTGADDHYVLYAPGAPGGQDMFEFSSWRSLSFVIGGWLATEGGARYIKDQTATTLSGDEHGFLEKVQAKPTLWSGSSVVFTELAGQNFEETLGRSVQQKVDRVLGVQEMTLTRFQHQTAYATPRSYALLTARIEALNQAFGTTTQHLVLFEEFARREANTAIAAYLKAEGSDTLIDADTLYFDLENATYTGSPDFSEYTRLRSVTRLYMESYSNSYAYKPSAPMYSSVGQNLAGLPTKFVKFIDKMLRDANAGSRYIDFLKDEFLNVKHPAYAYRKGLFGKRLHCDMRQAAMRDLFNGHLSERQYQWLVQMITSLDKTLFDQSKSLREVLKRSTVSHFRFAGHVVEGVYLFRDFSKPVEAFNLLYTPDAPDGISFRAVTDYPQLMSAGSMRGYYYRRVAYKAQPSVGSRFDDMDRNIAVSIEIENRETQNTDQITDVDRLYDRQIQCLITDVDDQTQSTHERWIENCYSVARKVGWLLLIPFPAASLAWTGFNLALDVQRGLSAYHYGDRAAASGILADSIFGAISGGLGVQGLTAAAGEGVTSLIKVWVGKKIVRAVFQ
jgi:hypothetical protein